MHVCLSQVMAAATDHCYRREGGRERRGASEGHTRSPLEFKGRTRTQILIHCVMFSFLK
jgi:hypothetical protein